jgi:Leucine-rich repeat (LRR) protein
VIRLAPDRRARLIEGYEEFPFDTAVPIYAFKNVSAVEISDIDHRTVFGWDRLAEQLRTLTVKRASIDDPADILIDIVLDDMDKRRRRSSKAQTSPTSTWAASSSPKRSPVLPHAELVRSGSAPGSPTADAKSDEGSDLRAPQMMRADSEGHRLTSKARPRSNSPVRPTSSRTGSAHGHTRGSHKMKRSGSGSSNSSISEWNPRGSSSNLLSMGVLPSSKWRFLKHLSLADNSMHSISAGGLAPLANTLHSLDLSSNLFAQIPDCLATLTSLRALNLSHCMIDSLHSLLRNPLPAITALNLRGNRLTSIAGIERLYPLERLDLRDNKLTDPTELARLTGIPELREVWVAGNPLCKTHPNYRVTIFNLFRGVPGRTEDILIDASGPGYSERRQLVERTAERPNVPVVKPSVPEYPSVDISKPAIIYPQPSSDPGAAKERTVPSSATGEIYTNSTRRKKASRRRIVDLSTSFDTPAKPLKPKSNTDKSHGPPVGSGDSGYGMSPEPPLLMAMPSYVTSNGRDQIIQSTPSLSQISTASDPIRPNPIESTYVPPPHEPTSADSKEWNVSGELYRQKIEALRSEVGSGWLSVLGEEGWDGHGHTARKDDVSSVRPSPTVLGSPRASSQQTISSGRTLG